MAFKSILLFLATALLTTGLPDRHAIGTTLTTFTSLVPTKTLYGPAPSTASSTKVTNVVASLDPKTGQETIWMKLGDPYSNKGKLKATYPVKDLPVAPLIYKTCVRTALTAMAKYRETCCHNPELDGVLRPSECNYPPTLERCCVETIPYNKSEFRDYPTYRRRYMAATPESAEDQKYPRAVWYKEMVGPLNSTRMIVHHKPEAYRTRDLEQDDKWKSTCEIWAPQFHKEYSYWMWKLNKYGIEDADENGKSFGMEKWGPDSVVYDRTAQWRSKESVCKPVYAGGLHYLEIERAIAKEGWHW